MDTSKPDPINDGLERELDRADGVMAIVLILVVVGGAAVAGLSALLGSL